MSDIQLTECHRQLLERAYENGALLFGDFCLKSGRKSPFFFNAGNFGDAKSLELIGKGFCDQIINNNVEFDVLLGLAYKGIPMAVCTSMLLSSSYKEDCPFAYDRKEVKDHGEGGCFVGNTKILLNRNDGCNVAVIDDVLTSGTALRHSINNIYEQNPKARISCILVLLDREEKLQGTGTSAVEAASKEFNCPVLSVLKMRHLIPFLKEKIATEENHEKRRILETNLRDLLEYRKAYGTECNYDL